MEVADGHQRRGIGTTLLRELGRLAQERGIGVFVATALPENLAVLGLLQRTGWPTDVCPEGNELNIVVNLASGYEPGLGLPTGPTPIRWCRAA